MRIYYYLIFLFCLLSSCKKNESNPPSVSIASPMANDTVYLSDSIAVQATIADKNLSTYKIILYNFYSKALLYTETGNATVGTFTIDKKIGFSMNADTLAYMNILGIDKNGNTGGAGVQFFIKNNR